MLSGASALASSGHFYLQTFNAGADGVSGDVNLYTGTSAFGDTGFISIDTGTSTAGREASLT